MVVDPAHLILLETLEETGVSIRVHSLVGLYSIPASRDLIAVFVASVEARNAWSATLVSSAAPWMIGSQR